MMEPLYSVGDFCICTKVILDCKSDSLTTVYQQLMKITDVYIKKNTFEYTCFYGLEKGVVFPIINKRKTPYQFK